MASSRAQSMWEYSRRSNMALGHEVRLELWLGRQRAAFPLGEERVENVMRHQRRIRAVHTVLEKHDTGNLGIVLRSKEEEPAVVAQVLAGLAGGRLALVRDDLRRSSLPGHVVAF